MEIQTVFSQQDFLLFSAANLKLLNSLHSLKGYSRLGAALSFLKRYDEAEKAYTKGLQLDPNNAQLKSGLEEAKAQAAR